jgi:hypothetical protein
MRSNAKPQRVEILREKYDMMLLFPFVPEEKDVIQTKMVKLQAFQRIMLGLDKQMGQMNRYKAVFRTPRCRNDIFASHFTTKQRTSLLRRKSVRVGSSRKPCQAGKLNELVEHMEEDAAYIAEWKAGLRNEWIHRLRELRGEDLNQTTNKDKQQQKSANSSNFFSVPSSFTSSYHRIRVTPEATEHEYSIIVAKSIAQRLQLTCGLTTHMFKNYNNDKIFLAVKADSADLKEEAARTKYHLQLRQRPFTPYHRAEDRNWGEAVQTMKVVQEAEEHLLSVTQELDPRYNKNSDGDSGADTMADSDTPSDVEGLEPEIDPLLFHAGDVERGTGGTSLAMVGRKLSRAKSRSRNKQSKLKGKIKGRISTRSSTRRRSATEIAAASFAQLFQKGERGQSCHAHPDVLWQCTVAMYCGRT